MQENSIEVFAIEKANFPKIVIHQRCHSNYKKIKSQLRQYVVSNNGIGVAVCFDLIYVLFRN